MNDISLAQQWDTQRQQVVEQMLAGGGGPGIASPDMIVGRSGLEIMQALLAGKVPYPPMADTMGVSLMQVEQGLAVFQGTPTRAHYNPMGSVHGGWFATLLDFALGAAVHSSLPANQGYTTADLHVHMVRAARSDTGPLRAIAKIVHCGRQLATAEGRIEGPDGTLYAHGTTSCILFSAGPR